MKKILFITNDVIGDSAAGPGIRYVELGKALSRLGFAVTVIGRTPEFSSPQPFTARRLSAGNLIRGVRSHDCVVVRGGGPLTTLLILLFGSRARIMSDYYAFTHFEVPHLAPASFSERCVVEFRRLFHSVKLDLHCRSIGTFWVAHERQQSFFHGLFFAKGIAAAKAIDLVPFGYPAARPAQGKRRLRGVVDGIGEDDFLLIWGGGVWDWLDPVTLVNAMAHVLERNRKIKLYFLGVRAPSGYMPEKGREMIGLCKTLGLLGRNVFVNEGWTPYAERTDYLLEADAGVSLHPASLETFFSFRTRNLDYVYCGLPMVHSEGDIWADLIRSRRLGAVVPVGDPRAVAQAILELHGDRQYYAEAKENVARLFPAYTWDVIAAEAAASIARTPRFRHRSLAGLVLNIAADYTLFGLRCLAVPLKVLRGR